jgi:hypothetical protein
LTREAPSAVQGIAAVSVVWVMVLDFDDLVRESFGDTLEAVVG